MERERYLLLLRKMVTVGSKRVITIFTTHNPKGPVHFAKQIQFWGKTKEANVSFLLA